MGVIKGLETSYENGELLFELGDSTTSSNSPTAIALLASFLDRTARQMLKNQHASEPPDPPKEGPVPEMCHWSRLRRAPAPGRYCVVCGGEQRHCRSGWVCEQGHGGADYTLGPPEPGAEPVTDSRP